MWGSALESGWKTLAATCLLVWMIAFHPQGALGDGMGFPQGIGADSHAPDGDPSEDLQLVYIEANRTYQRTELFVALKPLGAESYNLTLAVPMLFRPLFVDGGKMGTEAFRAEVGLVEAEAKWRRRNLGLGIDNIAAYLDFFRKRTSLHLVLPLSSLLTLNDAARGYSYSRSHWGTMGPGADSLPGVEHIETYDFEGISMKVYRFDDYPSLRLLMESLRLDIPDSARDEVEKYDAHYVSALTIQLVAPVEEGIVDFLRGTCPDTLDGFFDWLPGKDEHVARLKSELDTYPIYSFDLVRWASSYFSSLGIQEAETHAGEGLPPGVEERIRADMGSLVRGYLSLPEEGYRLIFTNKHNGTLWYPLGTSSSWGHPVELTEILVRLDEGLWIGNARPEPASFYADSPGRSFYWRIEKANPATDLEIGLTERSIIPPAVVVRNTMAVLLTGWYKETALGLNLLVILLSWLAALVFARSLVPLRRAPSSRRLMGLGVGLTMVTFFLSAVPVIFGYAVLHLRRSARSERVARRSQPGSVDPLKPLLASWVVFSLLVMVVTLGSGNPVMFFFFIIASGIWFALVGLVLAGPRFRWVGGSHGRMWGISLGLAFAAMVLYAISLPAALAMIAACLLAAALRRRTHLRTGI